MPTHASTGGPATLECSFGSVSCGLIAPFLWVWCMQNFVCVCGGSLCFPQCPERPVIKSHWPSRSDYLGIPSPFVGSPGWEAWPAVQNLHNGARTSWYYCSAVCGSPTQLVWIWFYHDCTPPTVSLWFLVFGCGTSFFGEFQHSPINGCLTVSCNFVALTGGDEHMGKTGSCFGGMTLLSKALIQLSADGWGCTPPSTLPSWLMLSIFVRITYSWFTV